MALLKDATKVYAGTQPVKAVYQGATKVWPIGFRPNDISGLVTWLDAQNYSVGSWPNGGSGPAVTIPGAPAPTVSVNQLNGMPLVRFTTGEGRVRSTWPYPVLDWTLVYLVRWVGPGVGRSWTVLYPPSNLLVGLHTSQPDTMYDNGTWVVAGTGWNWWTPGPGPWRMYGADSQSPGGVALFIDGTQVGARTEVQGYGLDNGWGLSGYGTGTEETMDIEVAELVLYNRKLSDAERKQVEAYLQEKWFGPKWDVDTQAYMTATGLDESFAPALDGLVTGLKDKGLWAKMSAIYPFIGGTAALHKWNLKDPRDVDAAYRLTYYGATSIHSTTLGYRANPPGATNNGPGYADTHFVPLGVLNQDSTHLSFYSLEDTPPGDRAEMGCFNWTGTSGSRFHIICRYSGVNAYYYGMSEEGTTNVGVPAASGLFVATRTGPAIQTAYRNGVSVGTNGNGSIALPPTSVWLGAINLFANKTDIPCGFASIGAGLTPQNNTDLYTIVQAFQTALGRAI